MHPILQSVADGTIKVLSDEECSLAEFRLCSVNRNMPDLLDGTCCQCGCVIYYCKSPPVGPDQKLICLICVQEVAKQ